MTKILNTMLTSQQISTMISDYNTIVTYTEGGSQNTFSYAGTGKSTYSFGLYQYDVGNNKNAQIFLLSVGFSQAQINLLSQKGGLSSSQLSALNTQLDAAMSNPVNASAIASLNNAQVTNLINQVQNSINSIATVNSDIANQILENQSLKLRMMDYANQFGLSPNLSTAGGMTRWLASLPQGTIITDSMVQNFVMSTPYAVGAQKSEINRQNALSSQLNTVLGKNTTY